MNKRVKEAKRKAKNIIQKALRERYKILSESELMKCMKAEADKIKQKILEDCKEIKQLAKEEIEKGK